MPSSRGIGPLTPFFDAWRVLDLGTREVTDAIVAPEHRGPSPALAEHLADWPGAWYWLDKGHTQLVLVALRGERRRERWWLHALLLGLTVVCALGAGAALAGVWFPPAEPGVLGALHGSLRFFEYLAQGDWRTVIQGWTFSVPLLTILLVHELGHYFAARRYEIDASPPFFLPVPPTLSPIGSLGAFIRIRSPVVDRRQLMDVGAAGPLAGFVVALAVLAWGYATSTPTPTAELIHANYVSFAGEPILLGDSLLTGAFRHWFFGNVPLLHLSLPAFAGWVGAFITALNLLPLSQLDGGHVLYGLFGRRQAALGLAAVVVLLYLAQYSITWLVWVIFALAVGRGTWTHPAVVVPEREVSASRRWLGWACILVFALTFPPIPFRQ